MYSNQRLKTPSRTLHIQNNKIYFHLFLLFEKSIQHYLIHAKSYRMKWRHRSFSGVAEGCNIKGLEKSI